MGDIERLREALEHLLNAAGPFAAIDVSGNAIPLDDPDGALHALDEAMDHAAAALAAAPRQGEEARPARCVEEGCVRAPGHVGAHTSRPYWPRELRDELALEPFTKVVVGIYDPATKQTETIVGDSASPRQGEPVEDGPDMRDWDVERELAYRLGTTLYEAALAGVTLDVRDRADLARLLPPLDVAWREAEAALPDGWVMEVGNDLEGTYWANGIGPENDGRHPFDFHRESSLAAALRALAAALSEPAEAGEPVIQEEK